MRASKCAQVQTDPYVGWVEGLFVESQLTTVHPHTDPWKAGSSAEGEGASLPAGILPSEQMGPSPGSRRTRMSALAASVFLICVFNLQETNSCSERQSLQSRSQEEGNQNFHLM